ncbi:endolysin [Lacticaseibacillus rhamnosus]|uniref:LysM peptidoglycan-binding domain-containing protein n=1 Tax=Lacticaseibacillus rhamnosus TaxID=47715 RepID=UPI00054AC4C4|nr:GH25 family lysozyme [Lacticaseibacillus rhamnosus]KHJ56511.1 endolysin [Lacticaseibacillus rhamnosus]
MRFKTKLVLTGVAIMAAFSFALPTPVKAAKNDIGVDWSVYQGNSGKTVGGDHFAIVQAGGTQGGTIYNQSTYESQVNAAKNGGLRVHSYLWYGVGGSSDIGRQALDYFLPRIQTPKGSIVALDYEDGASGSVEANTDAIIYGMQRIAQAGYTPMLYSYKPYIVAHVDYNRVLSQFPNSIWVAGYPDYQVRALPLYSYFPSLPGVAIWQFTSTHALGGLDGNVDLQGVTDNGYSKQPAQATTVPSTPSQASTSSDSDYVQTGVFKPSTTVNIRTGAGTGYASIGTYAPGESLMYDHVYIHNGYVWTRYLSYSGRYHYICLGVMGGESYGSRSSSYSAPSHTYYTVRSGDSFWSIANKYGINMYTLAANNGKSIYSLIYPGESLYIK